MRLGVAGSRCSFKARLSRDYYCAPQCKVGDRPVSRSPTHLRPIGFVSAAVLGSPNSHQCRHW